MRTAAERLAVTDGIFMDAAARGLMLKTADDRELDGRTIFLDGQELLNFGSCSYLGLEMHPALKEGVIEAVTRYGTQFSSSRSYLSAPPYLQLEELLRELFGGPVMVASSTSLGHISTIPTVVGEDDAIILDQQVHHSVHIAVNQARVQGTAVELIRHNRLDLLEERIEALRGTHRNIWYMADGVYSMFADLAPVEELVELQGRHEQLHLYIDDSHGMSWSGLHGRGYVLGTLPSRERVIVACSLNKAFAAAGGAFVFPDAEMARKVQTVGGPMVFSGPVQPPMLGAAIASAKIHLSPEIEQLQAALRERVALANALLQEFALPLVDVSPAPIRYVGCGLPRVGHTMAERLLGDGIYVNTAPFPAVPMKKGGIRMPITVHNRPEDITRLVEAIARHLPEVLEEEGTSVEEVRTAFGLPQLEATRTLPRASAPARAGLALEHVTSADELDAAEWDDLLGDRGSFDVRGLRFLEDAFRGNERPEDEWDFHYYVVRDELGDPVLATFFTSALWKDDMLSPKEVSERVEERRADDRYYLTSRAFAMGSLLTEGSHLYLDRTANWQAALRLLLDEVAEEQRRAEATMLVLRDFTDDPELEAFLLDEGLVRFPMMDSLVVDGAFADEEAQIAALSPKARAHYRHEVAPYNDQYSVEVLRAGGRVPSADELEHLYGLYRNVQARGLELNSFDLPRHVLSTMLEHDCWELVLLHLEPEAGGPADGRPVAFGAHFVGAEHYAPLVIGLDYRYVRSHRSYRQALRRAVRRAAELGAKRVLLGMGAPLEKRRFGARAERRCAYVQATDHYGMEVLANLEADVGSRA